MRNLKFLKQAVKALVPKNFVVRLSLLVSCFLFAENTKAATKYWVSTLGSVWSNTNAWSLSSGGAGGAGVPTSGDAVIFDGLGVGVCTVDAAVNVASITVNSGYIGTIIQGLNTITVSGAASFGGGSFTGGAANITISGAFTISGTLFTSTSAILEVRASASFTGGSFLHNNGTVKFNGSSSASILGTSPTFYTLEFVGKGNTYTISSTGNITVMNSLTTSGTLFYNLNTGTIDVKGDINSNNTATGCGGDALININGTGVQNFNGSTTAGAGALPQVTINKTLGSLNLANFPAVSNNFTYTAGTVNAGTSTFSFTHGNVGSYSITGTLSFANIAFNINTSLLTVTVANTITATGNLTISGGGNLVINTGNINVNGNITLTNTGNGGGGSATINIVGTGSQTLDGTAVTLNQDRLPVININKASGTLFLAGNISFASNLTYTTGTIDPGTSTCYIVNNLTITGTFSVYNLSISPAGNETLTIASGSTITATNTLDLENGANYININTGTIAVQGDIINNNTNTSGGGSGTILINGSGTQTISSTGIIDQGRFPAVTISKTGGTLVFPSLITVRGSWTYTSGTLDVLTNNSTVVFENTLTITGNHTLNNVNFFGSNNFTYTIAAGTTLAVSGTMSMTGASNIILNTGNINLNGNLVLTNTSTGGGGSATVSFVSGVDQTISSALLINQSCLPSIVMNKTGGTLFFPSLITVKGSWTYSAGLYDVTTNNSTIVFASPLGTGLFGITGTHTLNNVTFEGNNNSSVTVSAGTVLTVSGTLSTIGASNVFINATVNGTTVINAQGDISIGNTSVAGGGTGQILINRTGAQSFTSTAAASQGLLPYVKIQKTSGTLTLSGIFSESRDWTYTSGTVDATTNTSTLVFGGNNQIVPSNGMNFYHVIVTSNSVSLANNMTVYGNLTINGTGILLPVANTIFLRGNWTNRGTAGLTEGTSTINFNGSAVQTITSPGGENFTNLTVSNSGAGIQLVNDATIATSLTMSQGNIDLNGNNLTLGISTVNKGTLVRTTGTIFGTGSFKRWFNTTLVADGSINGLFPVGTSTNYRPFYVSFPATAPTTGGTIAIAYTDATTNSSVSISDPPSTVAVRKDLNWAMATANGLAGGTYNIRSEGTGFGKINSVTDLRLTLASGIVGTAGTNGGTITNPQVNRTGLSLANLTNTFYVGSIDATNSPLPITLISFNAYLVNEKVKLDWSTAEEINNDYFTVQRSKNSNDWENIQRVNGKGTTSIVTAYYVYDEAPYEGISYYRLMQADLDGRQTYSIVKTVDFESRFGAVSIYPNPTPDQINIHLKQIKNIEITLLDGNGRIINIAKIQGDNLVRINIASLANGIYFVHIKQDNKIYNYPVVKK